MKAALVIIALYAIGYLMKNPKGRSKRKLYRKPHNKPVRVQATSKQKAELDRLEDRRKKAELSKLELEQIQNQRTGLFNLYERLEEEYNHPNTTEARKTTLERQMFNLDTRLAKLDLKCAKLYQQIKR